MQQSDFYSDMSKWEKEMRKKDKQMRQKREQQIDGALPPVRNGIRIGIRNVTMPSSNSAQETTPASASKSYADAAQHTYDKGYAKWEKFDVEAALASEEENKDGARKHDEPVETVHPFLRAQRQALPEVSEPLGNQMPATEDRDPEVLCVVSNVTETIVQVAQREVGNAAFARGDYAAAVKSYTICLGLKKQNAVAFSNRAMAYLKLKEYHNAEIDCTSALAIDSSHVKSLHRRAAARASLESACEDECLRIKFAQGTPSANTVLRLSTYRRRSSCSQRIKLWQQRPSKSTTI